MAVYDKNGKMIKSARYIESASELLKHLKTGMQMQTFDEIARGLGYKPKTIKEHVYEYYLPETKISEVRVTETPSGEIKNFVKCSYKPIKSVYDDRTGKDDYETKWEYVDELCDRAIEAMDGDRDAMFFNSHLNDNGFVIKGRYIDMIEDNYSSWGYSVPNDLWQDVCKSLAMDKLARITKAVERKNGQLEVDWAGNGLMNSLNRNENSLRAVFGK